MLLSIPSTAAPLRPPASYIWYSTRRFTTELDSDQAVRLYAGALIGSHLVVALYLWTTGALLSITAALEPLCWPYFETCWQFRVPVDMLPSLFIAYAGLIAVAFIALSLGRSLLSWGTLIAINLFLFGLMSLDYRLRSNELYMLFWSQGVFLLLPNRRFTVPVTILSFYLWAGVLKTNAEWMSGSGLYYPLWLIPHSFTRFACGYVVALELVFSWGLLSRLRSIVSIVLAQLCLFHLQSLSQIHWFYPLLMGTILAWFPIVMLVEPERGRLTLSTLLKGRAPASSYVVMILFAFLQSIRFAYAGDPALTGQGRLWALHMFEARQVCTISATLHYTDGSTEVRDLKMRLPPRTVCDPIVYYNRVQNICRERLQDHVVNVDFRMESRRTTDSTLHTVVSTSSFCGPERNYAIFRNNDWLH